MRQLPAATLRPPAHRRHAVEPSSPAPPRGAIAHRRAPPSPRIRAEAATSAVAAASGRALRQPAGREAVRVPPPRGEGASGPPSRAEVCQPVHRPAVGESHRHDVATVEGHEGHVERPPRASADVLELDEPTVAGQVTQTLVEHCLVELRDHPLGTGTPQPPSSTHRATPKVSPWPSAAVEAAPTHVIAHLSDPHLLGTPQRRSRGTDRHRGAAPQGARSGRVVRRSHRCPRHLGRPRRPWGACRLRAAARARRPVVDRLGCELVLTGGNHDERRPWLGCSSEWRATTHRTA